MADLEFFFDVVCPWAWITSRWVHEVQTQRHLTVEWRFISLSTINAHRTDDAYTPAYKAVHMAGRHAHRVCAEARQQFGNEAVGELYAQLGFALHNQQRRPELIADPEGFMTAMLAGAGVPLDLAEAVHSAAHDALIDAETALAFERTGPDVGTPIITFHPGAADEASFFGPVIAEIPRGEAALRLFDSIEAVATTSGMAELKRSKRGLPNFD
jgi:protein-disulfide isomerase-like protein with CxxC motif